MSVKWKRELATLTGRVRLLFILFENKSLSICRQETAPLYKGQNLLVKPHVFLFY